MNNPFEVIDARLSNIETLLLDIKHNPKETVKISGQETSEYLTSKETAKLLKISKPTLHNKTKLGIIKAYKIGRRVLYKKDEVESALISIEPRII